MATNESAVKIDLPADLQESARSIYAAHEIVTGVRDEIINTGEHIINGITSPARTAIEQGPAATIEYLGTLTPASQLANSGSTLAKAAFGDDAAQKKIDHTLDMAADVATAFPKALGENTARGKLALEAGNSHEFGGALGAMAILGVGGPEAKAAEAAAASGIIRTVEGELVSTAESAVPTIAAETAAPSSIATDIHLATTPATVPATPAVTTPAPLATITDPKYSPAATALENSNLPDQAKQVLSPFAKVLDEARNTVAPPNPETLHEHMNAAVSASYKRDNVFKEALDHSDGGHIDARTGMTIAETAAYNTWNKAQVPARAEFYSEVFQHRPELAAQLEQKGITKESVNNLLMSPVNDHLMGIKPYEGHNGRTYVRGYEADEKLAKEWGIEYNKPKEGWGGFLQDLSGKNEITMNPQLQEAKKAVAAAEELQQKVHQDTALRLLVPELPRNPELDAKVQQLLAAIPENGTLNTEARQALPAELQALPAKHLEALQEKAQQAVATDQLRLTANQQETLLIGSSGQGGAKAETNIVATNYNVMSQAIRDSFGQSLTVSNNTMTPVAEIVPLTEAQIAAKQKVAEFTDGKGAIAKTSQFALDTLSGYSGMGYRAGRMEEAMLAETAAKSDYDFLVGATKSAVRKAATTVAVGTTAVFAPAALPAGFAAVVATRMVANNETAMAALKGTAESVKDLATSTLNNMRQPTHRDAVLETLPKDATGNLTPQSQVVMQLVDQQFNATAKHTPSIEP